MALPALAFDIQSKYRGQAAFRAAKDDANQTRQAMRLLMGEADRANAKIQNLGGSFGGLAAQFQDVGVSIAGGMSPALVALQQGTQIAGQLELALRSGGSASQVLRSALGSLVSPVSLLSIGATALVGLGLQYAFQSWGEEAVDAEKELEKLSESMERVKELGREIADISLSDLLSSSQSDRRIEVEIQRLEAMLASSRQRIATEFGDLGTMISGTMLSEISDAVSDAVLGLSDRKFANQLVAGIQQITEKFSEGKVGAERFEEAVIANISALRQMGVSIPPNVADEFLRMSEEALRLSDAIDQVRSDQVELSNGVKVSREIMESAFKAGAAAADNLTRSQNVARTAAETLEKELVRLERQWRADFILNVAVEGDITTVGQLLSAIGAPTSLVNGAYDSEDQAMKLQGAYAAMADGRSSPYQEGLNATYSLRDANSRKSGGGRARAAREADREAQAVQRVIEALEAERQQIGMTDAERRAANEIRSAGSGATDAQKTKIRELVFELDAAEREQKALNDATQFFENQAMNAFSAVTSQIDTGNAALDQFLATLLEVTAQAVLFGKGPLGGVFGGGLFGGGDAGGGGGGLLGGLFGGLPGFATGGSFTVGGSGSTDSKLIAFRATPGEMVNISRPGAGNDNVQINIINNSNASVSQSRRKTANGEAIDVTIDELVGSKASTPGSATSRAMRSQFGLRQGLNKR